MNISVKAEYALEAILDLSTHNRGEPVRIADIAKRQQIPQKFLEGILNTLKRGGFVASRRGSEGGYLLARPAESITVGDVLRFIEGGRHAAPSRRHPDTPFNELWRRVDDAVSAVVDTTTFAELSRAWKERHNKYVPNWEI